MKSSLSLLVLAAWLAPLVGAQSLSEAAAKERERRKSTPPAKVYTDADVRTVSPASADDEGDAATTGEKTPAEAKPAGEAGAAPAAKSPDEARADEEKSWREQVDKLNAEIARLDAEITYLESQSNDTRGYLYGARRTVALENLERARASRAAARQKLDDLLESGRRKGFRAP